MAHDLGTVGDRRQTTRSVLAGTIGTVVEYYDFTLYATATALVFNKIFFPSVDPLVGTIAAFSTFFVGYIARPLGGIVFGHFGDKFGRKGMLILTMLLMGIGTFAIGLVPAYDSIGVWAPVLLVVLRLLQGIGIGGEYGGGVLMAIEHAAPKRRGLVGSMVHIGVPAGFLLPIAFLGLLSTSLSEADFLAWGWRVPFLASLLLVGVGLFIRFSVHESPAFEQTRRDEGVATLPLVEVLRQHWHKVLLGIGAKVAESGLFNIYAVFAITYAVTQRGMPKAAALDAVLIGCVLECFTLPFFGWLSDRIGRVPVYVGGALFQAVLAFFFYGMADSGMTGLTVAIVLGLALGHGAMFGAQAAFFSELFPARIRYSGLSLVQQIGPILGGGLSPLLAASLLAGHPGDTMPISLYMAAIAVLSTLCAIGLGRLPGRTAGDARAGQPRSRSGSPTSAPTIKRV